MCGADYAADGGAAHCLDDARPMAIFPQIYISLCQSSPLTFLRSYPPFFSPTLLSCSHTKKIYLYIYIYIYVHFSDQPGHIFRLVSCSPLLICLSRNFSMSVLYSLLYFLAAPLFAWSLNYFLFALTLSAIPSPNPPILALTKWSLPRSL